MKQRLPVVDRDADLCEVFRGFFKEQGYEVETSADGLDSLTKLRQVTPAVLVLNLELLWGGGDGVLAWMREQSSAPEIPVLLTATATALPDMAEFTEPPVVDYLAKPFALSAQLERVRFALARKGRKESSNLNCDPHYLVLLVEW